MKPLKSALPWFACTLLLFHCTDLAAQPRPAKALKAGETEIEKETRKGLVVTNDSTEPWTFCVESLGKGSVERLELKGNRIARTTVKVGKEMAVPMPSEENQTGLWLSPVPDKKWFGKSDDFSARVYLKDSKGKKLHFTMTRVADSRKTQDKTCCYFFDKDFDPGRFEEVLLLPEREAAFQDKYTQPLHIIGKRLPPPGPKP